MALKIPALENSLFKIPNNYYETETCSDTHQNLRSVECHQRILHTSLIKR